MLWKKIGSIENIICNPIKTVVYKWIVVDHGLSHDLKQVEGIMWYKISGHVSSYGSCVFQDSVISELLTYFPGTMS